MPKNVNPVAVVTAYILLEQMHVTDNVRNANQLNKYAEVIRDSILTTGLETPLDVANDEKHTLVRGHTRLAAIRMIKDEHPEEYKKLFGKGVPCRVLQDVKTEREIVFAKVDQGAQFGLRLPSERLKAACMLFDQGYSAMEVADRLHGLLLQYGRKALTQEQQKEIDALKAKKQTLEVQKEQQRFWKKHFQGQVGPMKKVWELPACVRKTYEAIDNGEIPADLPIKITSANVDGLYKAFEKDKKIKDEDGVSLYNKMSPGPNFKEAWKGLVESSRSTKKVKGIKAMSAKTINAQIEDGHILSKGMILLSKQHAGEEGVNMEAVKMADHDLRIVELAKKYIPAEWKAFVKKVNTAAEAAVK